MRLPSGIELRFHPDERHFPCWYDDSLSEPEHPCFFVSGRHQGSSRDYACEAYQFYFKENLAIGLPSTLRLVSEKSKTCGYHKHDVEGIHILYDDETENPLFVYFKAHGVGQGIWKKWEECERNQNGALVVYVAWGSHAMYPSSKNATRVFGFANDRVSKDGRRLLIAEDNCVPASFVEFSAGCRIYDTIQPISNKSITTRERVVLPFVSKKLRKKAMK